MQLTCGVDWAEAHHDVALVDVDGAVVARSRIDTGANGFNELLTLIAEHGGSAEHTAIALQTDKNLLVVALAEAGFTVYPINPRAVARYRERYGQAGGKSDPGDAAVLAPILRTDRHLHRPLPAVSDQARAIKTLARQHQEAVWALQHTVNRLRSVLLEFYPQALQAAQPGGHSRNFAYSGPSLDVRRTEAPDPDYRGTGGPLFVEPVPDPNPVEPAMVEGVIRRAQGCRGRLRAPRSSRDGVAAVKSRRGGMDAPHQKLSVQPELALRGLAVPPSLYTSTVRPETTPLAMRVPFPVGGSPFCATRRRSASSCGQRTVVSSRLVSGRSCRGFDEHRGDVLVRDAALLEGGYHTIVEVSVVPTGN